MVINKTFFLFIFLFLIHNRFCLVTLYVARWCLRQNTNPTLTSKSLCSTSLTYCGSRIPLFMKKLMNPPCHEAQQVRTCRRSFAQRQGWGLYIIISIIFFRSGAPLYVTLSVCLSVYTHFSLLHFSVLFCNTQRRLLK